MTYIDSAILDLTEWLCHKVQLLTGRTNVWLLLTQTILKVSIEAYEHNAYRRVAKGFRNPRRVREVSLRIPFLTLSFVLFYPIRLVYINFRVHKALLSYSLIVLTTVVLYLLACDQLAPCVGKLREWLRGAAPSRLPASESPH